MAHKPKRRKLTELGVKTLIKALDLYHFQDAYYEKRMRLAILLTLDTALRRHEVAKLRYQDINVQGGYLSIVGKGDKRRVVPINPYVMQELLNWKASDWISGQPVFNGWTGNGIYIAFKKLRDCTGLDIDFHGLRRTASTVWLENEVDIHVIQRLMGHVKIDQTIEYVGFEDHRVLQYMSKHESTKRKPSWVKVG